MWGPRGFPTKATSFPRPKATSFPHLFVDLIAIFLFSLVGIFHQQLGEDAQLAYHEIGTMDIWDYVDCCFMWSRPA
jgi:hypothetical protein